MIKCNRCGSVNTAGAVRCQSCGSVLSSMDTSGSNSNAMSQEQSALPAWLESLRVGERAPRPTTNSPKFSTVDLIEEGSLPSWMHAQRNETQNVTGANMPVPLRPSSLPAPSTDSQPFPAPGFAAQSLIDERALPSWMQEREASTPLPPQTGIPAALPPQGGMPAANLVDHGSVPDWMKSLQQRPSGVADPRQPTQVPSTESEVKRVEPVLGPPSSSPVFAARDLVDQQSLPDWMTQLNNQNSAASASREPLKQQSDSFSRSVMNEQQQPIQPGQTRFSAHDLIDQQSLPAWMLPQKGQNPSNSSGQEKQSNQPPATGLPASSLLDMNALPAWLTGNEQRQGASSASSQPPTPMTSSNRPLPSQQPAMQGPPTDLSPGQGGRIAASSVIDMTALPEWLRSAGDQQSVPQTPSQSAPAPYAGPPRVENVRVPSRPRDEVSASETSEMAATVFASMLGVASTTPKFPAPSGVPYQQQYGQVSSGEQMTPSGMSGLAGMPSQAGISMLGVANPGGANMVGGAGGPRGQNMSGTLGPQSNTLGVTGRSGDQGMYGMPGDQSMPGIPRDSGMHSMAGMPGGPGGQSMTGIPGGSGMHSMAGMPGGPGGQSMTGIPGGSGMHSMYGMPGGPGGQSMTGIPGGSGMHSMYGMPGGPGGQSMTGIPGGSGMHSMAGMPGGPGGQSMTGIPGGSGMHSMAGMPGGPGGQSMTGIPGGSGMHSMAGMPGGPGGQSMTGIPGGSGMHSMYGMPGGQSMAGNAYGNPAQPNAGDNKNAKKRGLFGALLDWLSR